MAKKFYAVRRGKKTGVFTTWDECKEAVHGFSGAEYKSFATYEQADEFIQNHTGVQQSKEFNLNELSEQEAVAYVDGSYNVNTKEYSYGVVFFYQSQEEHFCLKMNDPEMAEMRNVAGEILGAKKAMEVALEKGCKKIKIYHDYEGIAKWCLGDWKTNKEGTKNYKSYYDSIKDKLLVEFVKVKGHSNDKYNDLADELAKSVIF